MDENGAAFVPVGATLKDIAHIDLTGLDEAVRCIPFTTMCDIDNPLCGPAGASAVFGPQKGLTLPWCGGWTRDCAIWRRCSSAAQAGTC